MDGLFLFSRFGQILARKDLGYVDHGFAEPVVALNAK
jgi:hypothetical protein